MREIRVLETCKKKINTKNSSGFSVFSLANSLNFSFKMAVKLFQVFIIKSLIEFYRLILSALALTFLQSSLLLQFL